MKDEPLRQLTAKNDEIVETCAGVYLIGLNEKHARINELLLARVYPRYKNTINGEFEDFEIIEGKFVSLRTVGKVPIPEAQEKEREVLKAAGWKPGPGAPIPTLQSSVDAYVDVICTPGHYILVGYTMASSYFGISERSLRRYDTPREQIGNTVVFNITSATSYLEEHGKV